MNRFLPALIFLQVLVGMCRAQSPDSNVFEFFTLEEGLLLNRNWKFHPGDNARWADPALYDKSWQSINPTQDIHYLTELREAEIGWFRLHLKVDTSLLNKPLAMLIFQRGASEIYLNGKLIRRLGIVSKDDEEEVLFNPNFTPYSFQFTGATEQVLAVRYSFTKSNPYLNFLGIWGGNPALLIRLMPMDKAVASMVDSWSVAISRLTGKATFLFFLALLHLFFYVTYPVKRENLYYSLFTLCLALGYFLEQVFRFMPREGSSYFVIGLICSIFFTLYPICALLAVYAHARQKHGPYFWLVALCALLFIISWRWPYEAGYYFFPVFNLLGPLDAVRVSGQAIRKKIPGAWVVFFGWLGFLVFMALFCLFFYNILPRFPYDIAITLDLAIFCGAVIFSLVLVLEYAQTNRSLKDSEREAEWQRMEARKLQDLDEAKSRFFANLSHEFRTPLSLIRGTAEKLASKDKDSPERQPDYTIINRQTDKLLQMINQLLDLSKLEAGKLELHVQPDDINSFLKQLGGSFVSLYESKGINFYYTVPLQAVWAEFDKEKIEIIVSNLLSNAAKFTPAGSEVRFTATLENEEANCCLLTILVQDTGIGIPAQHLPHIFNRFYQVDSTATRAYEGAGIGLSLAKELVELHGGTIEVESKEGEGTTFVVTLSLAKASPALRQAPAICATNGKEVAAIPVLHKSNAVITEEHTGKSFPTTVLLVEDNADLRQFLKENLSGKYQVLEARDGQKGYEQALKDVPDLIISDVMMPAMDGVTLCHKLKTDERTSHIPIILLTAKADTESRLQGLETGADDYLTKPFGLEEIQLRVHNLIEGRRKLRERFSKQLTLQPTEIAVTSTDEKFLQKVMAVLEVNMANAEFDVETFGKEIGMSRGHLHRKLTALVDQSPSEFIRTIRLKRATHLLSQQGGNISEVAYQVGFNSVTYFSKCFRELYGQTPSEYISAKPPVPYRP
jgi:signal transduction histidine kinase/DNA-binding response OmpR family regulator